MASIIQCDVCKNTCKIEESFYLVVSSVTKSNECGKKMFSKDLCPRCYEKLNKFVEER